MITSSNIIIQIIIFFIDLFETSCLTESKPVVYHYFVWQKKIFKENRNKHTPNNPIVRFLNLQDTNGQDKVKKF